MLFNLLNWYYYFKLKKLIKQNKYHKWISFLEFSNFLNILVNPNAIISFRTFYDRLNLIYKILIKKLYPKAKLVIFNSKENENYLKNLLKLKNTITIYNPINFVEIKQEEVEKNIKDFVENRKVFITVWRLIKIKHQDKIINALSQINDNWCLLILWNWPERKNLENLVKKLWVENKVKFLWAVKNVFKYLNIANYFIYTSKFEGFPNAVLEAIYLWLPIITSNFKTGVKELIEPDLDLNTKLELPYWGSNGVIIDLNNYEKQFKEVYENIEKIKQERKWIERFSIDNILGKWRKSFR